MENESHRLEIPENIPLRWELWRELPLRRRTAYRLENVYRQAEAPRRSDRRGALFVFTYSPKVVTVPMKMGRQAWVSTIM